MSETTSDPFLLVGGVLDGKYEVSAVVAEGGFGVVYRATHIGLAKTVALKVLKVPEELTAAARETYLEKFQQEARLIAALEHPAIVRVVDFGASQMPHGATAPWMVLEWLEGSTLETVLDAREGQGMPPAEVLQLLEPVFAAIGLAHEEGIAHRDLKPANLMQVRSKRGESTLKVLDFGIAKFSDEAERNDGVSGATRTNSKMVAFSLQYAAPEQVTGMRTGAWTDVHALALIVVELLTGRPALQGGDMSELYAAVLAPLRPTPARRGMDVGAWEPVLARALGFKPAERPRDAHALLQALKEALPGARWQPAEGTNQQGVATDGGVGAKIDSLPTLPAAVLDGDEASPPTLGVVAVASHPSSSTLRGAEVAIGQGAPRRRGPIAAAVAIVLVAVVAVTLSLGSRTTTETRVRSPVTPAAPPTTQIAPSPVAPPPTQLAPVESDAGVAAESLQSEMPPADSGDQRTRRVRGRRAPRGEGPARSPTPSRTAPTEAQAIPLE